MIGPMRFERAVFIRFGLPTLAIGLCAALLGWSAGETVLPPMATIAATPWSLPPPADSDPARDLALLTQRKAWSPGLLGAAGPAVALAGPPKWRLAGVVQRDDGTFALIASGTDATAKLDYLRVGEPVPDGGILVAITANSAVVEDAHASSGQRVYKLFDKKPDDYPLLNGSAVPAPVPPHTDVLPPPPGGSPLPPRPQVDVPPGGSLPAPSLPPRPQAPGRR
jgi:hypothetical protein